MDSWNLSIKMPASFIVTLHLVEKWQRHPAADLRGYKPFLQFTIFSSNKSVNYFYLKMKDAKYGLCVEKQKDIKKNSSDDLWLNNYPKSWPAKKITADI